jgi:uncharacterized protein GlcG (DUF336 family)
MFPNINPLRSRFFLVTDAEWIIMIARHLMVTMAIVSTNTRQRAASRKPQAASLSCRLTSRKAMSTEWCDVRQQKIKEIEVVVDYNAAC